MQNKIKQSAANKTLSAFAYVLLTIGSIICVLPFIVIVSGSFTDNATIITKGYSLLPKNFTTAAY
ncbi:MAG: carbohydrate ABC transporter permease, partial [Lachnospiraceae bacterium]|nr:carbohydrate ABC transporter permease [Lachnospiraceae bacterium]